MKIFLEKNKIKSEDVVANDIKIFWSMKNKRQLSIEKKFYKTWKNRTVSQIKIG